VTTILPLGDGELAVSHAHHHISAGDGGFRARGADADRLPSPDSMAGWRERVQQQLIVDYLTAHRREFPRSLPVPRTSAWTLWAERLMQRYPTRVVSMARPATIVGTR
jgi:hypothetical protein